MVTIDSLRNRNDKIAVIGLGYVGLPLAVHLSAHFDVFGYDLKESRIKELISGVDKTLEVPNALLKQARIHYTTDPKDLSLCRFIIVAVPTPIDEYKIPDLTPLRLASQDVGNNMSKGSCIVYESTVFPGATEEVCVPIIEKVSGLKLGVDFTVGYSPERINPGDSEHSLENIVKIVSGSDAGTLALIESVYGTIVKAGLHKASSIKVAEAAKVIENTQRDLNIALMNELSMIFEKMSIDTIEVLEAAGTKWNFLKFRPGLVGGHCIGVDPYYLTFKAESLGYHPEMILAGRRINDGMGKYIAEHTVKQLIRAGKLILGARVAVLGITFKENVPDIRNTRVIDIINELHDYGIEVVVHDPMADAEETQKYYGLKLEEFNHIKNADAVVIAVLHSFYKKLGLSRIADLCSDNGQAVIIDVKSAFDPAEAAQLNIRYWRL